MSFGVQFVVPFALALEPIAEFHESIARLLLTSLVLENILDVLAPGVECLSAEYRLLRLHCLDVLRVLHLGQERGYSSIAWIDSAPSRSLSGGPI